MQYPNWFRQNRMAMAGVLAVAVLVVASGSSREAADPTKPVVVRGHITHQRTESPILRVATFNIHSGKGRDRRLDLSRTVRVLDAPDIVGLNEVRGTFWPDVQPDQAAQLGSLAGMQSIFLATERRWWHDHFGNALLTRLPLQHIHRIPLVCTRGKAFRSATLSQFEFNQRTIQLLSVHVDVESDHDHQLQAVVSLFEGLQPPVILMGDLNGTSDDPPLRELLKRDDVVDVLASRKTELSERKPIDWILVRGFRCLDGRLIENDASDHPAVCAELELLPTITDATKSTQ